MLAIEREKQAIDQDRQEVEALRERMENLQAQPSGDDEEKQRLIAEAALAKQQLEERERQLNDREEEVESLRRDLESKTSELHKGAQISRISNGSSEIPRDSVSSNGSRPPVAPKPKTSVIQEELQRSHVSFPQINLTCLVINHSQLVIN